MMPSLCAFRRLACVKLKVVVKIMVPIRVILGLYWGYMGDNGKENGNYCKACRQDRHFRLCSATSLGAALWSIFQILCEGFSRKTMQAGSGQALPNKRPSASSFHHSCGLGG